MNDWPLTSTQLLCGSYNPSLGSHAAHLFPQPLACQSLFDTPLFPRLKVERMLLYILDDVFLLDLTLEASESTFEGLSFIQNDFRQSSHLLRDEGISYLPSSSLSRPSDRQ
jgi:hypothetical protein